MEGKITGDADLTLTADSLQLQSTGTVVLQGTVKDVTLRSASGDVDGQIKADTADLQLAAGDLTLHDSALGDAFVRVSSGSIALENVTAAQELRINSSAGSVTAQGGSAQSLLCQSAMGDVTLRGMTVEQLEIQVSAGKIMVDTPQSASDVSVKAQASAGECHLDGSACGKSYLREGGAASWQLVSSAGDIDLTFAK
ncbi:MAG: DUF4097 family beta strand repeat-containing protein [Eubacteriales bacterium]|nr:DUF4097 family beta strand repeat-containing protein [Eubacteriales bacterium]